MNRLSVSTTRTEAILGWIYMVLQLLVLPTVLVLINLYLGSPLTEAEVNFVFFCLNFTCITVIFHRFLISSAKVAFLTPLRCLKAAFFGLAAYWVLSYVVVILILMIYPDFSNVNDSAIGVMTRDNYTLMAIGTVILVPVAEEVLFRGLIFQGLYNRSRFLAYAVSTIAFCVPHVIGYIGLYEPLHLLMCFLQYVPAGLCLGWAYARADSIWAPILMHITVNQIGILSMR